MQFDSVEIIDEIINNPNSRRIMMTTYNPSQTHLGVLPPCHSIVLQFYVINGFLDISCYNRSQDTFLGTPFNIASTALLCIIIAAMTNLTPRFFHLNMGDAHIYESHIEAVQAQLDRIPFVFPMISIKKEFTIETLKTLVYSDFKLENYQYHPIIKASMIA